MYVPKGILFALLFKCSENKAKEKWGMPYNYHVVRVRVKM